MNTVECACHDEILVGGERRESFYLESRDGVKEIDEQGDAR